MTKKNASDHVLVPIESAVAIFGAGAFSQAVATMVAATGRPVRIWARDKKQRTQVQEQLPAAVVTGDMEEACEGARFIVFGVPADAVEEVAKEYGDFARGDHVVVHGVRGFGRDCSLAHQAIRNQTCVRLVGALGGPLYFDDLRAGRPVVTVVASRFAETQSAVSAVTANTPVRVHTSSDIIGVEVAGAVSNITHLAVGMADALKLGETGRGILLTHGLADAERLGVSMGAMPMTFGGLAGVGDLIPRPVRSTERHHQVGAAMAFGETVDKALSKVEGSVEGIASARYGAAHAAKTGLSLPLIEGVASILDAGADPRETLEAILSRDIRIGVENVRRAS